MSTLDRMTEYRRALNECLLEREQEVDAILLGLVAKENVLFVGEPGTAKSLLTDLTAAGVADCDYFEQLMHKYTEPDDMFGPVKLDPEKFKEGVRERPMDCYAAVAKLTKLDEVWKAGPAILNTLLTYLMERRVDNGGKRHDVPLWSSIGLSNEWPSSEEQQELGAMFDRFLVRRTVKQISRSKRRELRYKILPVMERPVVTMADLEAAHNESLLLPFSEEAMQAQDDIYDALCEAGCRPNDRRDRKSVVVAQAAAWLDGASEVQPRHLECLKDVLWSDPSQIKKCDEIVTQIANPVAAELDRILEEAIEATAEAKDPPGYARAMNKIMECQDRCKILIHTGNGRAKKVYEHLAFERSRMSSKMCGISEDKFLELSGGKK